MGRYEGHAPPPSLLSLQGVFSFARINGRLLVGGRVLASFNDTVWATLGKVAGGSRGGIHSIFPYRGKVLIGGDFTGLRGQPIAAFAVWDGDTTFTQAYGLDSVFGTFTTIQSMIEYDSQLYLGGTLTNLVNAGISGIIRFNGTDWHGTPGYQPSNTTPFQGGKMVVWRNELYTVGSFIGVNGPKLGVIFRWDTTARRRPGSSVDYNGLVTGSVYDIAVYHDKLYAVGNFSYAGNSPQQQIARWDGSQWCRLPAIFNGQPSALAVFRDTLYVGGFFRSINGDTSLHNLVKWTGEDSVYQCGLQPTGIFAAGANTGYQVFPNPVTESLTIRYSDNALQSTFILVDVTGRELTRMALPHARGNAVLAMGSYAPGIYLYRIVSGSGLLLAQGRLSKV